MGGQTDCLCRLSSRGVLPSVILLLLPCLLATTTATPAHLPIVLWHGMGDSCCSSYSLGAVKTFIQDTLDDVFVLSISTGSDSSAADDTYSGFFGSVNFQVARVCELLANTTELQQGYNAIGFSQGGQFMRAVLERCQHTGPRMHTLVTMGAQHQGIMNVPECWNPSFNVTPAKPFCWAMQRILGWGAYLPWVRSHVIQAQYFKDPYRLDDYLKYNSFLPDINNELPDKSARYKANFQSLERLVLVRFVGDVTVVPRESSWFGFFDGKQLQTMNQTQLYQEDWIGLRHLDESRRVDLLDCPGPHMHFGLKWLKEHVIEPYFAKPGTRLQRPYRSSDLLTSAD